MNPFKLYFFKAEWLRFSRDRVNLGLLALFALLCLGAALNGLQQVRQRTQAQAQTTADTEQRLAHMQRALADIAPDRPLVAQGPDPASPAKLANGDGSFRVGLPPLAGAALSSGTSTLLPQAIEVSSRSRHTQASQQNLRNPAITDSGGFDLGFVVVVLLPLLAIALAWRIRAHDRELGTWALIAAVPGAARGLLVAALALRLVLLFGIAGLAGAVAVFGSAGAGLAALTAWASFAAITLLYAALWLGLAAWLNRSDLPSPTLALSLVGLWMLAVFVLPAAIDAGSTTPPSRLALIAELRALDAQARIDGEALDEGYRAAHPEALPGLNAPQKGDHRIRLFSTQLAFDRQAQRSVATVDAAVAARQAQIERWSWLSPALAAQLALEAAAGTDLHRQQDFMRQVDAYQMRWRDYFRPMVLAMRNLRAADYDAIPRFAYRAYTVPAGTGLPAAWLRGVGALALWLAGAALLALAWRRRRSGDT